METSAPATADAAPEEVRLWGIPDRTDWAKGFQLRARTRPLFRRLFPWLLAGAYLVLPILAFETNPEATFVLVVGFVAVVLRVRRGRNQRLDRIMAKAARTGVCPLWRFIPEGVHIQGVGHEFFYEWSTLDAVAADDDLVILMANRYTIECIPGRFFRSPEDTTRLLDLARGAGLPVTDYRKAKPQS